LFPIVLVVVLVLVLDFVFGSEGEKDYRSGWN
jgi:hypothetical protein